MAFLLLIYVVLGISQCLAASVGQTKVPPPRVAVEKMCLNSTSLLENQKGIFETCKDFDMINKTHSLDKNNIPDVLCTLYYHNLLSYCHSNKTIKYPKLDEIKTNNYSLSSVCESILNSSKSIFPKDPILEYPCLNICTSLKANEIEPECLFAHYYYRQSNEIPVAQLLPPSANQNLNTQNGKPAIISPKVETADANAADQQKAVQETHLQKDSEIAPEKPEGNSGIPQPAQNIQEIPPENTEDKTSSEKKEPKVDVPPKTSTSSTNASIAKSNKDVLTEAVPNDSAADAHAPAGTLNEKPKAEPDLNIDNDKEQNDPDDTAKVEEDEGEHGGDADYPEQPNTNDAPPQTAVKEEHKNTEKKPDTTVQEISPVNNDNLDEVDGESYFFSYFMVICVLFVLGYVAYHNRIKVMALVLEGKRNKRQHRGRRPNSANYHKLDSNLEEAISSNVTKNSNNVIY